MAAPCDKFYRVNGFIQKACLNAEDNRKLCELICADSRKLFQHWPPEILSRSTSPRLADLETSAIPETSIPCRKDGRTTDDDEVSLTEEEVRALAEVEDILVKAHEARKLQAKITKSTAKTARIYLKSKIAKKQDICHHQSDEGIQCEQSISSTSIGSENDKDSNHQAGVIAQSKFDRLLDLTAKPSKSSTGIDRTVAKAKSHRNAKMPRKPGSLGTSSVVKVPRSSSAAKMQYKTSSSDIGRHSRVDKTRKPKSSGTTSRYAQTRRQDISGGDQMIKPPIHRRAVHSSDSSSGRGCSTLQQQPSHPAAGPSSSDSERSTTLHQQPSDVADLVDRTQKMTMACTEENNRLQDEEVKPFLLRTDGSELKVPVKLKKMHSNSQKLWDKLATTSIIHLSDNSRTENHFKKRLETKFSSDTPPQSCRDLEVKVEQLHTECSHLCHIARELLKQSDTVTGTCTWQEIYRSKAMLHTITSQYNELQEEIYHLRKAEKTLIAKSKHKATADLSDLSSLWRSKKSSYSSSAKQTSYGTLSSLSDQGTSSGGSASSVLQYDRKKDLQRLASLQYQAQFVMWQMDFEKMIAEDILPILQTMDPTDDEFIPLYRTIYGLVCHSGEAYPSVVSDNIGGNGDDEEHHDNG